MIRLDIYLEKNKYLESRKKAKDHILKGQVLVNSKPVKKPSFLVSKDDLVEVLNVDKYVARSAHKLLQAFSDFSIDCNNCIALDVGSSTGGFTQVLLEKGASKVYALDVGKKQLHESLRNRKEVVSIENQDIRTIDRDFFTHKIDFVTCDVSFISITKVLHPIFNILSSKGRGVFLIKPQFEVGREKIGKKGLVKSEKDRQESLEKVIDKIKEVGFAVLGSIQSSLLGSQGNVEYLVYITKD